MSLTWSLESGLPDWLEVPTTPVRPETWRRDVTLVLELLEDVDAQLAEVAVPVEAPFQVEAAIDSLLEFSDSLPEDQHLVAGLTVPGRWPLPVVLTVSATGDDPQDLLWAAGAKGGEAIELPIVEYLPDDLGDGIRVTRFDLGDDGAVWATVSCARRGDGIDTLVTWRTVELDLVPLFSRDLERLIGRVRVGAMA